MPAGWALEGEAMAELPDVRFLTVAEVADLMRVLNRSYRAERREWLSGTSARLANLARSNTNVQCPCRMPINEHTHDPECTSKKCFNLKC